MLRKKDGPKPPKKNETEAIEQIKKNAKLIEQNKKSPTTVLDQSTDKPTASTGVKSTGTIPKRFLNGPALTGATTLSVGSLSEPSAFPDS